MIKRIIFCLFFVTQIYCLIEDDKKTYKEDEVDITTPLTSVNDIPKIYDQNVPQIDSKEQKEVSKELPKEIPYPDIKDKEQIPKESVNNDKDSDYDKQESKVPGVDPLSDDKTIKKVDKPLVGSEPDIHLEKDYKKTEIKPNNQKESEKGVPIEPNTDFEQDKNQKEYGNEERKPDISIKPEDESPKEKGSPEYNHQNGYKDNVRIANEIVDTLLKSIKSDYRSDFERVKLSDIKPFEHGRWGSVLLHSGVVTGLTNAQRVGDVVVADESGHKKLITGHISVTDVYADYKMNAKLFHRLSFKDRDLKLWLKKAIMSVKLEVHKNEKKLIVQELDLKSFEGFTAKSGRLFWPFNKLTNAIVKNQEQVIKNLIKKEFSKYMGKVVHSIPFDETFGKLF